MQLSILMHQSCFITSWMPFSLEEDIDNFLTSLKGHPKYSLHTYLLAVPYTHFEAISKKIDSEHIILGCPEMNSADPGQFTETIAGRLLQTKGAKFVLIGTSECRHKWHESDESINRKVLSALSSNVIPFLCLGETAQQMDDDTSAEIIKDQFEKGTAGLSSDQLKDIVIIFEAPWLATTLREITSAMVLERYDLYRKTLVAILGADLASKLNYVYGFSHQIHNLEYVYHALQGNGFYTSKPESLLQMLSISAANYVPAEHASAPISQITALLIDNEIPLPLDVEFESEIISANIIPENLQQKSKQNSMTNLPSESLPNLPNEPLPGVPEEVPPINPPEISPLKEPSVVEPPIEEPLKEEPPIPPPLQDPPQETNTPKAS